nr:tRNA lysidine(34) synthetase TilS [Tsuneonella aeria]
MAAVWPSGLDEVTPLGVAVSGGPDSVALLLLAHALNSGRVEAATVDHGLRADSATEAAEVAALCDRLGIPHVVLRVELSAGNMHDAARTARYAALADWARARGLPAVATAHHADDQAETVLMRLNRASGLAGLSGIRPSTKVPGTEVSVIRPLLGWRKAELFAIVREAGVETADDPSNRDPRFDRARIRAALAHGDWADPVAFARSAALLHESNQAMEWMVGKLWQAATDQAEDTLAWRPTDEPRALRLAIIARAVAEVGGRDAMRSDIARLHDTLESGAARAANVAGVLVSRDGDTWTFQPEPTRRN